jgi:hypothetical protein
MCIKSGHHDQVSWYGSIFPLKLLADRKLFYQTLAQESILDADLDIKQQIC